MMALVAMPSAGPKAMLGGPRGAGLGRQGEVDLGALAGRGGEPQAAAVQLDDLLADGQPQAGARVAVAGVGAVEGLQDALEVLGGDADAVVAHDDVPQVEVALDADVDVRRVG